MANTIRTISIVLCAASLGACMSYNPNGYMNYQSYTYEGEPIYPESFDGNFSHQDYRQQQQRQSRPVIVPETYHVGAYHSPRRAKDRDRTWVDRQNPQGYTIEIAEGNKASSVARKLQKAPKTDRMAQIRYQRNGQSYYKGLLGSYSSYDAAQKAYNELPADVKQGAKIQSWGSVQNTR